MDETETPIHNAGYVPEDYGDMWPFDDAATCNACGSDDIGALFLANAHEWSCRDHRPSREDACCSFQHIHRHCRRCHKAWIEAPLDVTENVRKMLREASHNAGAQA